MHEGFFEHVMPPGGEGVVEHYSNDMHDLPVRAKQLVEEAMQEDASGQDGAGRLLHMAGGQIALLCKMAGRHLEDKTYMP
jgi:hypothetical protein